MHQDPPPPPPPPHTHTHTHTHTQRTTNQENVPVSLHIMSCMTCIIVTSRTTCLQQSENKGNISAWIPLRISCNLILTIQIWSCNPNVIFILCNSRIWGILLSRDITWISIKVMTHISMVSCQKGPTRHAYAWQIGPFWQDLYLSLYIYIYIT